VCVQRLPLNSGSCVTKMDTTGCPPGFASDHVFMYGTDFIPLSCNVPIAFFTTFFVVLCLIRVFINYIQIRTWLQRERKLQEKTGVSRRRIPIVPITSLIATISLVLYTILVSVNIANSRNGLPFLFLAILYLPMASTATFLMFRLVRLGKQLIPLGRAKLERLGAGESGEEKLAELGRFNTILKFCISIHIMATAGTPIAALVNLSYPVYETFQVACVCYATQDIIIASGIVYQYQRVIWAIQSCRYGAETQTSNQRNDVKRAVFRLRMQQVMLLLLCPFAAIIWILNATRAVLPFYW
jgi:hypothetical protein